MCVINISVTLMLAGHYFSLNFIIIITQSTELPHIIKGARHIDFHMDANMSCAFLRFYLLGVPHILMYSPQEIYGKFGATVGGVSYTRISVRKLAL